MLLALFWQSHPNNGYALMVVREFGGKKRKKVTEQRRTFTTC
jgi:hypothetical protein